MQELLLKLLEYGFSLYKGNSVLEKAMFSKETTIISIGKSISKAIKLTLKLNVNMMNKNSFV